MANELITKTDIFMMNENGDMIVRPEAMTAIRDIESQFKTFEKQYKKFKKMLLEGMEEYGIKKIESEDDDLLVTYVEPGEQVRIDNDRLWAEHKDIAFECQKVVPVKGSIRITVR